MSQTYWIPFKEVTIGDSIRLCIDKSLLNKVKLEDKFCQVIFNPESVFPGSLMENIYDKDQKKFIDNLANLEISESLKLQLYNASVQAIQQYNKNYETDSNLLVQQLLHIITRKNAIQEAQKRKVTFKTEDTIIPQNTSPTVNKPTPNNVFALPWPVYAQQTTTGTFSNAFAPKSSDWIDLLFDKQHDPFCEDPKTCFCGFLP